MKCPHCQGDLEVVAGGERPSPQAAGAPVTPASADGFRDLCHTLRRHPACTDPKFKEALESFPKGLAQYRSLTAGQWKFFCAIHKQVLGAWPPKPEDILGPSRRESTEVDLEEVPF